jgi:hypothetical protein
VAVGSVIEMLHEVLHGFSRSVTRPAVLDLLALAGLAMAFVAVGDACLQRSIEGPSALAVEHRVSLS